MLVILHHEFDKRMRELVYVDMLICRKPPDAFPSFLSLRFFCGYKALCLEIILLRRLFV